MFTPAYFTTGYFTPQFWPPGLLIEIEEKDVGGKRRAKKPLPLVDAPYSVLPKESVESLTQAAKQLETQSGVVSQRKITKARKSILNAALKASSDGQKKRLRNLARRVENVKKSRTKTTKALEDIQRELRLNWILQDDEDAILVLL